jgi:hypothetical protein
MARPLGIEYPGAIYYVMSRGDWREASASALKMAWVCQDLMPDPSFIPFDNYPTLAAFSRECFRDGQMSRARSPHAPSARVVVAGQL